jgi:hypothetical protein
MPRASMSEIGDRSIEMPQRKFNFSVDDKAEPPISIEESGLEVVPGTLPDTPLEYRRQAG